MRYRSFGGILGEMKLRRFAQLYTETSGISLAL